MLWGEFFQFETGLMLAAKPGRLPSNRTLVNDDLECLFTHIRRESKRRGMVNLPVFAFSIKEK